MRWAALLRLPCHQRGPCLPGASLPGAPVCTAPAAGTGRLSSRHMGQSNTLISSRVETPQRFWGPSAIGIRFRANIPPCSAGWSCIGKFTRSFAPRASPRKRRVCWSTISLTPPPPSTFRPPLWSGMRPRAVWQNMLGCRAMVSTGRFFFFMGVMWICLSMRLYAKIGKMRTPIGEVVPNSQRMVDWWSHPAAIALSPFSPFHISHNCKPSYKRPSTGSCITEGSPH